MKLTQLSRHKRIFIILSLIVILGFGLRIYRLERPSLWFDELCTAARVTCSFPQVVRNLSNAPFSPPLYYMMMNLWVKGFGDTEFSLRFPSLIFSVLTIIFIFKLSCELFNEKVGLFAALFVSISPYSIYYAQEAKMYSMLWMFSVLSFLFFNRFRKDNSTRNLWLYILFTTAAIYTLYLGFIFIIIQNIAYLPFAHDKRLRKWLQGQLAVFLLYLPWWEKFFRWLFHRIGPSWIPIVTNYPSFLGCVYSRALTGMITKSNALELAVYSVLIFSAIVKRTNMRRQGFFLDFKKDDYFLFMWILVPVVIYCLFNLFVCPFFSERTTRYIGFIYLPLIILISKGINKYALRIKAVVLIYLLIVTFFYRVFPLYKYNFRVLHGDNYREFSLELQRRAKGATLIISALLPRLVRYYNRNYEIKPLDYIDTLRMQPFEQKADSIFIVYRNQKSIDRVSIQSRLKGYQLKEDYYQHPNGFLWFEKSKFSFK